MRVKTAQRSKKPGGLLRVLTDSAWTDWLPIYAWVIDHPEGIIVVDTGETARTSDPDYFPRWHPYYRGSVRMNVWKLDLGKPALLEKLAAARVKSAVAENLEKLKQLLEEGRVVLQDGRQATL